MAVLLPQGRQQFFDAAGAPLVGGKVHTYEAGTSTPKATYTDAAGAVANANPVVLNARGEAIIFWAADAAYKVVVTDANGATIWTQDDVSSPTGGSGGSASVGFLQSGAGAVARTVQDKLREYVSVKDFGAVGDGSADDTPAIQAAIDYGANRATIHFPSGSYKITSPLRVPSNVTMKGAGRDFGTQLTPVGCAAFEIDGTLYGGGWVFRILIADMIVMGASAAANQIILINRAYNTEVKNVFVYNQPDSVASAVKVSGSNNIVLEDFIAYGSNTSTFRGIDVDGTAEGVSIKIVRPDIEVYNRGIRATGTVSMDIVSPHSERCIVNYEHDITSGIVNIFGGLLSSVNGYPLGIKGDNLIVHGTDLSPYLAGVRGGRGFSATDTEHYRNVRLLNIPRTSDTGFVDATTNRLSVDVVPAPITGHFRRQVDLYKSLPDNVATNLFSLNSIDYAKVTLKLHGYVGAASLVQEHKFTIISSSTVSPVVSQTIIDTSAGNWTVAMTVAPAVASGVVTVSATANTGGGLGEGQPFTLYGTLEIEGKEDLMGGVYLL